MAKFHCKSDAQKKAIRRNYAKKAEKEKNSGRTASGKVPQGRTLTTHDNYLGGKKTTSKKNAPGCCNRGKCAK